jgi:hypothetical protein
VRQFLTDGWIAWQPAPIGPILRLRRVRLYA